MPQSQLILTQSPLYWKLELPEISPNRVKQLLYGRGFHEIECVLLFPEKNPLTHLKSYGINSPCQNPVTRSCGNQAQNQRFRETFGRHHQNGISIQYDEEGFKTAEVNFVNGKQEGITKKYENGQLKYELNYQGKALNGIVKEYEKGKLKAAWRYQNGLKDGITTIYYPSGTKKLELRYKKGKLNGISKEYFENGNLKAEWNYKDGVLN